MDLRGSQEKREINARSLRLRAGAVRRNDQHSSVHDSGAVEHRLHQDFMTGTIYEADVANKLHLSSAADARAHGRVNFACVRAVSLRPGAKGIIALEDL